MNVNLFLLFIVQDGLRFSYWRISSFGCSLSLHRAGRCGSLFTFISRLTISAVDCLSGVRFIGSQKLCFHCFFFLIAIVMLTTCPLILDGIAYKSFPQQFIKASFTYDDVLISTQSFYFNTLGRLLGFLSSTRRRCSSTTQRRRISTAISWALYGS